MTFTNIAKTRKVSTNTLFSNVDRSIWKTFCYDKWVFLKLKKLP